MANEYIYNHQLITDYLLGSLPETEAERLDELSVTDDQFVDALRIAEKDLIDAYVHGELSSKDLEKFNSYYLASPLRREKVKFAETFKILSEKDSIGKKTTDGNGRLWSLLVGFFTLSHLKIHWRFAIPAFVILLIIGSWLAFQNIRLRKELAETQANQDELKEKEKELQKLFEDQRLASLKKEQELIQARQQSEQLKQELANKKTEVNQPPISTTPSTKMSVASFILSPTLRSGSLQTLSVPANTDYVAIQLELESDDYPSYRVILQELPSNKTLWQKGKLKTTTKGEVKVLNVSLQPNLLKSQTYTMQVIGLLASGDSEIVSNYTFKVVKL
jgi:hypothetical protein